MNEEITIDIQRQHILQRVKECSHFNNLVAMECIIDFEERAIDNFTQEYSQKTSSEQEALRPHLEDAKKFINELKEYRDDLKIKNFLNSLGKQDEGFQLYMLKFREKLIADLKGELNAKTI